MPDSLYKSSGEPLRGRISQATLPSLQDFAQPYFDRAAARELQRPLTVPMQASRVSSRGKGEYDLVYRAEILGGHIFEIAARIHAESDGSYKMMEIRSDVFRPGKLNASVNKFELASSLAQESTLKSLKAETDTDTVPDQSLNGTVETASLDGQATTNMETKDITPLEGESNVQPATEGQAESTASEAESTPAATAASAADAQTLAQAAAFAAARYAYAQGVASGQIVPMMAGMV